MLDFSSRDKAILTKLGYNEDEIFEIESGEYEYLSNYKRQVTEKCAINSLGRKNWLLSIGRAYFHKAAVCNCRKENGTIYTTRV